MKGFERLSHVAGTALGILAGGCLALFALVTSLHGWDLKYLGLMVGAGLLWLARHLPGATRVSVTLFLLSTGTILLLANLVLGVKQEMDRTFPRSHWLEGKAGSKYLPALRLAAQQLNLPFDRRTRLEVMLDLRRNGIDAWPSMSSPLLFADYPRAMTEPLLTIDGLPFLPLGGISNVTAVHCNESGQHALIDNDEHGFSNPRGLWEKGPVDVAVVGDSFAHGACVPPTETFPARIRERIPSTINLGNDAIGPLIEMAVAKEYLAHLRPKVVIWTYFESNDLPELRKEQTSVLKQYLQHGFSQGLLEKQERIDRELREYVDSVLNAGSPRTTLIAMVLGARRLCSSGANLERLLKLSYLWEATAGWLRSMRPDPVAHSPSQDRWIPQPAATRQELELFQDILRQTQAIVSPWGGQLLFVYLPQYERYGRQDFSDLNRDPLLEVVRSLNVPVVDIHQAFQSHGDPLSLFPFRQPAHYTAEGYRLVAEKIVHWLERMLPPGSVHPPAAPS